MMYNEGDDGDGEREGTWTVQQVGGGVGDEADVHAYRRLQCDRDALDAVAAANAETEAQNRQGANRRRAPITLPANCMQQ